MKYDILNRFTGAVQASVEIVCPADASPYLKLGLAVTAALKSGAYLSGADLRSAYLSGAYLRSAYLSGADLRSADLSGAYLSGADLRSAYLSGAYLRSADLRSADLSGADLSGAIGSDYVIAATRILPEGTLIGWKKLRDGIVAKLEIPAEAKRSHAFGRKCRAEWAKCLELSDGKTEGLSSHDDTTVYRPGEIIKPDRFDENWLEECSSGIHFFITKLEAESY